MVTDIFDADLFEECCEAVLFILFFFILFLLSGFQAGIDI